MKKKTKTTLIVTILIVSTLSLSLIALWWLGIPKFTFRGYDVKDGNPLFKTPQSSWGYQFAGRRMVSPTGYTCTDLVCDDGYMHSWTNDKVQTDYTLSFSNYDWISITMGDEQNFIQGSPAQVKVYIDSTFPATITSPGWRGLGGETPPAVLCLDAYWTATHPFTGETMVRDVIRCDEQIATGQSIFLYDVPTEEIGTYIFHFKPNIYVVDASSTTVEWTRMQLYSSEVEYKVQVIPQPIYIVIDCLTNPCPDGYTCQEESGLCLRIDIIEKQLTCQELGCPIIPDKTYECSSSGICVETVYVYKDCGIFGCPLDLTCEPTSGICIRTEIVQELLQCKIPADCMIPCDGLSVDCTDYKCTYSGECEIKVIQCIQNLDCPATPCIGIDSLCQDNRCVFSGRCEKEIVQCEYDSDCPPEPCIGVTRSCVNNKCVFSGECEKEIVQCEYDTNCPVPPCTGVVRFCENNKCVFYGECEVIQCQSNIDCPDPPCIGVSVNCINNKCAFSGECQAKIIQCDLSTDCPSSPCDGITRECINNKCVFSGECKPRIIQCSLDSDCPPPPCTGVESVCTDNQCIYLGECGLLQCKKHSDCPNPPCIGVESICIDNVCKFMGTCDPTYIRIDCSTPDGTCPDGYACDKSMSPAVCIREIYVYEDCSIKNDDGTPRYPCPEDFECINNRCVKELILDCNVLGCSKDYTCDPRGFCKKEIIQEVSCDILGCPKDYVCDSVTGACFKAIYVDCNIMDCPQGFECNSETGNCLQFITDKLTCRELGCPKDYECDEVMGVCKKEGEVMIPWIWIIVGFVVLFLIMVIIILALKTR